MTNTISADELSARTKFATVELIDVRTPAEFRELHVSFARNIPLSDLDVDDVLHERDASNQDPIYFICQSGARGEQACKLFEKIGIQNVVNVEGGTKAWQASGLSVEQGKKTVSLERQVRIAAGSLVFLGSALGYFASPYWIAVPAFIGAGLVFAGVTDTCGMGMMLARMPWNQVGRTAKKSTPGNPKRSAA